MLASLDELKLASLERDGDDDDGYHLRAARRFFAERDLAEGMLRLLDTFEVFEPRLAREKEVYEKWCVKFRGSPFRSLRIRPRSDCGVPSAESVVDIYAFEKHVESFQMLECQKNWPLIIKWLWDYSKNRQMDHSKHRVPRSRRKLKKGGEPLHRQVLRTTGFKARNGVICKPKGLAAIQENADTTTGNGDVMKSPTAKRYVLQIRMNKEGLDMKRWA